MSSPVCTICQMNNAITSCVECKQLVCGDCSGSCQVCAKSLCKNHVQLTSHGRKLCPHCMAERNAQRKRLKAERRKQKAKEEQAASTSFENLSDSSTGTSPGFAGKPISSAAASVSAGTSFEDIFDGTPVLKPQAVEEDDERDADLVSAGNMGDQEYDDLDPAEKERQAKLGRTEAESTESGRLELPPMDENRPVLSASGYQPPSRLRKMMAFVFFGIGMMYFWTATPYLKETMLPWDAPKLEYNQDQMATYKHDDNRIRNSSNINQFEFFAQGPFFFIAWLVVLSYVGGVLAITFSIIRSAWWSWRAKLNLEAADDLEKDRNELLM